MDDKTTKIDFLIAGAQKSGTTALAAYLDQHPGIYIPPTKELHLFRRWPGRYGPSQSEIDKKFTDAPKGKLLGEATPIYMYWPQSPEMISYHNPDMKIIISLRHPVLRAYSAWSMEVKRGRETLPFREAIREGRQRVVKAKGGVHLIYSYVERGFYGRQMEKLLSVFPKSQIYVMRSEWVQAEHGALLEIFPFLGLSEISFKPLNKNVFPSSIQDDSKALAADFAYLQDLYMDDMKNLEAQTGIDFQDWRANVPSLHSYGWRPNEL